MKRAAVNHPLPRASRPQRKHPATKNVAHPLRPSFVLYASLLVFVLSALLSCQPRDTYHCFQSLPQEGWKRGDTLFFPLPPAAKAGPVYPYIELRHTTAYPYRSLWLVVTHNTADSTVFVNDTIECVLTDAKGHFNGAGVGALYQTGHALPPFRLGKGQQPVVKISHYMLTTPLQGVTDVGLRLSSEPRRSAKR